MNDVIDPVTDATGPRIKFPPICTCIAVSIAAFDPRIAAVPAEPCVGAVSTVGS